MNARLLLAALALSAGEAAAHAELVASYPADGASLAAPPARIELVFNEPVTPLDAKLFDRAGRSLPLSPPRSEGERIEIELPASLVEGHYTFTYRVVSLDSHPIGGAIAFGIGVAPVERGGVVEGDALAPWRIALRATRDLALLTAAGSALFILTIAGFSRERAVIAVAGTLAALAALLGIGFQGSALLGTESPFAGEAWRAALESTFGTSSLVAAGAALMLASAVWLSPGAVRSAALAAAALAAIASLPLTGHAAARGGAFAPAVLGVHALAAAFWAGSLVALLRIVRTSTGANASSALYRFSRLGVPAVTLLLAAGIAFAWLQLPALSDLIGSDYGRLIIGKLALFAGLIALAGVNRFRYLPRLTAGDAAARTKLGRSIGAEIALMGGVVALTALLVQTPPPRAAAIAQEARSGDVIAELHVAPGRAGVNAITVRFRVPQGRAFDPEEVAIEAASPAAGVEPAARPMLRLRAGEFRREGGELAFPGVWSLEVQARVGDFERPAFRFEVRVR